MTKATYQIYGTKKEDLDKELIGAGLIPILFNEELSENQAFNLVDTLNVEDKRKMANGELKFGIKSKTKFANRNGTVTVIDFDLEEVTKIKRDPWVEIDEKNPGTLISLVLKITTKAIKVDIIKSALLSMDSDGFKTSVMDLARITGEEPNLVYKKCISTIVQSCIIGMQRLEVISEEPIERQLQNQDGGIYI